MSNLSADELDRVLLQLFNETAPAQPSDEEAQAVVRWAEDSRINATMLEMVLAGDATVRSENGAVSFKLTAQGMTAAEDLLRESPAARARHDELVADALQKPLLKGPNDEQ